MYVHEEFINFPFIKILQLFLYIILYLHGFSYFHFFQRKKF